MAEGRKNAINETNIKELLIKTDAVYNIMRRWIEIPNNHDLNGYEALADEFEEKSKNNLKIKHTSENFSKSGMNIILRVEEKLLNYRMSKTDLNNIKEARKLLLPIYLSYKLKQKSRSSS